MGMKGETMVVKRSIAKLVRKKLSDITNTQTPLKLHIRAEKPPDTSASDKNCIEQLLKEKATLMQLLAERDKIIELNEAELLRLRANVEKLQLQNWNLAQSNTQMLVELNSGRERMKALQHEVLCKAALLQGNSLDVGEGVKTADQPLVKASNEEKLCDSIRKRNKRSRSIGCVSLSTKDANESKEKRETRSELRRQSANLKGRELKPMKKNSSGSENAKTPVSQNGPNLMKSPAKEDKTFGKPVRKAAEKVQPNKEIPPKVKLRRLE